MVAQEVISAQVEAHPARAHSASPGMTRQADPGPVTALRPSIQVDGAQVMITVMTVLAVVAFELFNFDSTRFALADLLGEVTFLGVSWAVILALAFCSLDFAGLARLFQPLDQADQPVRAWYLLGAWFLAAVMNAMMTWWAVSVRLAASDLGNEVLSHEQLLHYGPIFLAIFVWLTRLMLIGAVASASRRALYHEPEAVEGASAETARVVTRVQPWAQAPRPTGSGSDSRSVRLSPGSPATARPTKPRPQPMPES